MGVAGGKMSWENNEPGRGLFLKEKKRGGRNGLKIQLKREAKEAFNLK